MHKGRDYRLCLPVRVFMVDATYPRWTADSYVWDSIGSGSWMGTPPLPTATGPFTLTLDSIDPADGSFSFRAPVGTFGGRLIEIGFVAWLQDPPTAVNISRMVWCDGAEQLVRGATSGGSSSHWELLQSSAGVVPVSGAQVWNTYHFTGTAAPY